MTEAESAEERRSRSGVVRAIVDHLGWLSILWELPTRHSRAVPAWALISAGLSPLLLTAAWTAAGLLQPPHSYSPVRETVSVLAGLGAPDRWIMTDALVVVGALYLVTAAGLTAVRLPARAMLALAGASSFGIAANPEPASGPTLAHLAWTGIGGVTIAMWPAVAGWRARTGLPVLSTRGSAFVTGLFVSLLLWVVLETQGGSDLGMAERLTSSLATAWPFVVALALYRSGDRGVGAVEELDESAQAVPESSEPA